MGQARAATHPLRHAARWSDIWEPGIARARPRRATVLKLFHPHGDSPVYDALCEWHNRFRCATR